MQPIKERSLLRDLAQRVAEIASLPIQAEKVALWKACNDLAPVRPMVYADPQNGWKEIDTAWIPLACEDPINREWERRLRRLIVRHERIPDDCPITASFPVNLRIRGKGYEDYGIPLETVRSGAELGAYRITPVIRTRDDLDRLRFRPITVNRDATNRELARARDTFGDILDVRVFGQRSWRYGLTRVAVHMIGLETMFTAMYDDPLLLQRLMSFFRDDFLRELRILEEQRAFSPNNTPDGVNGSGGLGYTSDLPDATDDGVSDAALLPAPPGGYRTCRCWGESQETGGIGPAQFEEYVLEYQLPLLEQFGLVDYGCCEPVDSRLDILVRRVPNLRWVSVSPWANRALAAEKLGRRYVYVYKPNPARVCSPQPDWEGAEDEIRTTLRTARGCPVHIVLKDTHTFCGQPDRVTRWVRMAMRVVEESA